MVTIYEGAESIKNVANALKETHAQRILLVTGGKSYEQSGAQEALSPQLLHCYVKRVEGFHSMLRLDQVRMVADTIRKGGYDLVIAVGGGSVLDAAKAGTLLSSEDGPLDDYILGSKKARGSRIPKILIPTTAGSGAEITPFAVVYKGETKYSLEHPSMVPQWIVLDPQLTLSLSPAITAATAADAISQAIESYWSVNSTSVSQTYAAQALSLLLPNALQAVTNPTLIVRYAMLKGANLAGQAIAISKTTAAHSLSYPLTAHYGIPHGHACMLTLPSFFPVNAQATADTIQKKTGFTLERAQHDMQTLLELLHVANATEAKEYLEHLMDQMQLPRRLSALGVPRNDLELLVEESSNPQRIANNPVVITPPIIRAILESIY